MLAPKVIPVSQVVSRLIERKEADKHNRESSGIVFAYRWRHIPTGTEGVTTRRFPNRETFLMALNMWNDQDFGVYVFVENQS